jgi:hypothetical protein
MNGRGGAQAYSFPGQEPRFPSQMDDLGKLDAGDNRLQKYRQLRDELQAGFDARKDRRHRELSAMLKSHHRKRLVLIMTLNRGHMDLLLNWVASCDHHAIEVRSWTVIFALDTVSAAQLEQLGFTVYCDPESYGSPPQEAAECFGDRTFMRLMFPKTAVVQDILEAGYDVLFQDVDLVWIKDPARLLQHRSRRFPDAQFMYDGPNIRYAPVHANSGFFILRNTGPGRRFWSLVFDNFDKILYYRSQQVVVNIVLNNQVFRGLQLDILSEELFANGHLFTWNDMSRLPPDPWVIHASWTTNIEHKITKLKLAGHWYL